MADHDRAALAADIRARTGLDEALLERVVQAFYRKARADDLLGPVFAGAIEADSWPGHLSRMVAFWSSVALMSGSYHGRPVPAHARLLVDAAHFDRWLELFRATAREIGPPEGAAYLIDKAERIAASLEAAVEAQQGRSLGRAGSFRMPT